MSDYGCGKRPYGSEHAARQRNRWARFRVRVYWCRECRAYHVANADKKYDGVKS